MKMLLVVASLLVTCSYGGAAQPSASSSAAPVDTLGADSPKGFAGFVKRAYEGVTGYFAKANEPHPEKKLDISFIGGPHYSSESGFGLGLVGSGLYYAARDSLGMPEVGTPESNVALKVDVTTGQLFQIGTEGCHVFRGDSYRIDYDGYFYSFKDKFWGIGYANGRNRENESDFRRLQARLKADFVFNIGGRFFVGPYSQFSYVNATRIDRRDLFEGQSPRTFTTGLGVTMVYDTRDVQFNAYRGVYVRYNQLFNPRFLANKYAFSESELSLAVYFPAWKDCVVASMLHVDFTYGNTPWGLMPSLGGSERMRGYYEGRYRDKCEADLTIEFRQHIWRRHGVVLWLGVGEVAPTPGSFKAKHVLPNIGVGYRWQFKPRVNVRLDFGIGKGDTGVYFSINEAF